MISNWKEKILNKYDQYISEYPTDPINSWGIECNKGWNKLIRDCFDSLIKLNIAFTVTQIKEKFGGLRFYTQFIYENNNENLVKTFYDTIKTYENKSLVTCECCGRKGLRRSIDGYMITLCWFHNITKRMF